MVDPNRKINRLTDKDIEFLEECEREFAMRYTEDDTEFMEHCSKPLDEPPIIENWNNSHYSRNDRGGRNYRSGNRNWRNNFRNRRGGRDDFDGRNRSSVQTHERTIYQSSNNPRLNIRKDYNNFVAASKDN